MISIISLIFPKICNIYYYQFVFCTKGWGSEFFRGPSSRILQEAAVRVWDQSECQNAWKEKRIILSSMVCAGGEDGIDSCQVIYFMATILRRRDVYNDPMLDW